MFPNDNQKAEKDASGTSNGSDCEWDTATRIEVSRRSILRIGGAAVAAPLLVGASSTASSADDGSWTIVALPDTQYYAERDSLNKYAYAQTDWIAENVDAENIVFVTHEGDLVQEGNETDQWDVMDKAMSTLDEATVPYSVLPGNHDYAVTRDRSSELDNYRRYFGASRFDGYDWYGGTGPDEANSYQLFSAGGHDFLHLALEWEARDTALEWAQGVLDRYPDRATIVTTHAYLTDGDKYDDTWDEVKPGRTQFVEEEDGDGNPGEQIWQRLIKPNPQVFMVLNGHYHEDGGEYHQTSKNARGQQVFEMLANYQRRKQRGYSLLRLISFEPGGGDPDRIRVSTCNPYKDEYEDDADSEFDFTLDFEERFNSDFSKETVSFQQGTGGYEGTSDTNLREADPQTAYGTASEVTVDIEDPQNSDNHAQALVQFDGVVGDGDGQVPPGATVRSATLTVETVDDGDGGAVHRLLRDWSESDTWASLDGGISADGSEATADPEAETGAVPTGTTSIDVTAGVRAWVGGEPNHGWAILPLGDDGWDFSTAEGETPPHLSVTFQAGSDDGEDDTDSGEDGTDDGGDDTDSGDDGTDDGGDDTDSGDDGTDSGDDGTDSGEDETDSGEDGTDGGEDEPTETLPGDADGDGDVDQADVDLTQRHVANEDVDIDRDAADVDGDGDVDIADVVDIVGKTGGE